jgi:dipeptidase D
MESDAYQGLEPIQLWRHFAALNAIPRPSGQEGRARDYVLAVARAAGVEALVDARGNAIVRVPPQPGISGPVVAIQGHLDMVCDADPGVTHDWARDPVVPRREGDLIFASDTTLGADNGIGVAACLSLIESKEVRHGGLELLFTVDEESGRWGALDLDVSLLTAELLINLDSEDADALTIGAAGGSGLDITMPLELEPTPADALGIELRITGLRGGHSGLEIHERRANAIKLIALALSRLQAADLEWRLDSMQGGSTATAIARRAQAGMTIAADGLAAAEALVGDIREELRVDWADSEPDLVLELATRPAPDSVLTEGSATRLLSLLEGLPHGALAQSSDFEGTVETSANLATVGLAGGEAQVVASARSLSPESLQDVEDLARDVARGQGARVRIFDSYPSWQPRRHSMLVDAAAAAYRTTYGKDPRLEVLHGGLECGAIIAAKPGLDAVSFGPRIVGAHTPTEHVHAPTVVTTWRLLTTLLERLVSAS